MVELTNTQLKQSLHWYTQHSKFIDLQKQKVDSIDDHSWFNSFIKQLYDMILVLQVFQADFLQHHRIASIIAISINSGSSKSMTKQWKAEDNYLKQKLTNKKKAIEKENKVTDNKIAYEYTWFHYVIVEKTKM